MGGLSDADLPSRRSSKLNLAFAGFFVENRFLLSYRIDEDTLTAGTGGEKLIERGAVSVATAQKLFHQQLMPIVESFLFADPAQGLRMPRVSAFATMLGQNVPKAMQLAMFGEQMLPAQMFRMYVPDAHRDSFISYKTFYRQNIRIKPSRLSP